MKKCNKCGESYPPETYHINQDSPDGLKSICPGCVCENRRRHYLQNKERTLAQNRKWAKRNAKQDREVRTARAKRRYQEDPQHRLRHNLRKRVTQALGRGQKAGSAVRDLGCTIEELMSHLEFQFSGEMTWKNYGSCWEIDHVIPLASFDLTDREQFLRATNYTNLQPLTGEENKLKSDKRH